MLRADLTSTVGKTAPDSDVSVWAAAGEVEGAWIGAIQTLIDGVTERVEAIQS